MSETASCFLHGDFDPALRRCPECVPAINFTAVDHAAECIREALRKLPVLDPDVTAANEGLGALLATLEMRRVALDRLLRAARTENFNRPARASNMSNALRSAIHHAEETLNG
jgi:hypothetical protein